VGSAVDTSGIDQRRARRVRDLTELLNNVSLDGPPALEAYIGEIRAVLETDVALAYGVLDAGDHLELRFMRGSGNVDFARGQLEFSAWLRGFPDKTGWAAYNPLRPEREQQNRVYAARRTKHLRRPFPVARALHPRFGLDAHDFMRALICDGPALLAWVGVFQRGTIAAWQRASLKALIVPLRRRLIVERRLDRFGTTQAALEVLLEATASAAFILDERGAIEPGNGLARFALRTGRKATLESLRSALRDGGAGYTITPLGARGVQRSYLAIAHAPGRPLHRAKAAAAQSRFRLSERQVEVLELLLQGTTGASIASALGIAPNTLDKHMSALFERVGVENRYALIARVTAL
jgi:DNA-binding CsgD family transcriptional regulator